MKVVAHENLDLLCVDDPALLAELRGDRRVAPLIVMLLNERMAVIAPGQADALIERLLKAGHMPQVQHGG